MVASCPGAAMPIIQIRRYILNKKLSVLDRRFQAISKYWSFQWFCVLEPNGANLSQKSTG
jgi:hypothetical protein